MLAIAIFAWLAYCLAIQRGQRRRHSLYLTTVLVSLFFFSSRDPFVQAPLYMYCMILSTLLSLGSKREKATGRELLVLFCLLAALLAGMAALASGAITEPVFLLKKSSTDVYGDDISSQLFVPELDLVVLKHLAFFLAYLIFLVANRDLVRSRSVSARLFRLVKAGFALLALLTLFEWAVVNATGFNDREFMHQLFSVEKTSVGQDVNWSSPLGFTAVAAWFSEPSGFCVSIVLYLVLFAQEKMSGGDWLLMLGVAACSLWSGSSTALAMAAVFLLLMMFRRVFSPCVTLPAAWVLICGLAACLVVVVSLYPEMLAELFSNIGQYVEGGGDYGSAYFRRRSNDLALQAIAAHPLFGLGIGTLYCHGMLFQTIANIGLVGFLSSLAFHRLVVGARFNGFYVLALALLMVFWTSAFMVQSFTSPMLLAMLLPVYSLADSALSADTSRREPRESDE